jgi:hypothetical protein
MTINALSSSLARRQLDDDAPSRFAQADDAAATAGDDTPQDRAAPAPPPPPAPSQRDALNRYPAPALPAQARMALWAESRGARTNRESSEPTWRGRGPAAAAASPTAPTAPAAPRRNVGERAASAAYVGERPVDAAWLAQRESAFKALRAEYEAARTTARAGNGAGPGWVEAATLYDERTGTYQTQGLLMASDPAAPPLRRGHDNGVPYDNSPTGSTMVFSEEAFAAHFKAQQSAQPGNALKSLAACYAADAATLLAKQPGLWALAVKDHALNAGPPPPGRAMGDAAQLGTLDLYLADPQIAALITAYGGKAVAATGPIAIEQVRLYGAERFAQLSRLNNAMGAVRNHYSQALTQAEQSGRGVGWSEHTQTVTEVGDNENAHQSTTRQVTTRTFDPDAFTARYIKQDGLANKAFASFYGQSHTTYSVGYSNVGGESGESSSQTRVATLSFDNPNWTIHSAGSLVSPLRGLGGGMSHTALRPININDTPRLHDRSAVGFDLDAGWVTHPSNIREKRDWLETVVVGAIVGVVSYVSAGLGSQAAVGFLGMATGSTGAAVVGAAAAGAAASTVSGAINGNLTWKGILQGALAGGLSAGLLNGPLGAAVANSGAGAVGTIALRTTVQGGIQALLGGEFKDGAIAGFASGLAELASTNLQTGIDKAAASGNMTAAQAITARSAARIVGSAIRALGNPDDAQHAFASSLLSDLMPKEAAAPAVTQPALDDDGHLMPGVVDAAAPPAQQALQLAEQLERQGLPADQAAQQALQTIGLRTAGTAPPAASPPEPGSSGADGDTQRIEVIGQRLPRDALGNSYSTDSSGQQIAHLAQGGGMLALGTRAVPITGNSAVPGMALLRTLAAESVRAAGTLLTIAGNTGVGAQRVQLDENTRFEARPGELQGRLLERQPDGSWLARDEPHFGWQTTAGFRVLSEDELRNLQQPTATPGAPLPPQPMPPLPIDTPPREGTPGYTALPPAGPVIETLPAAPPLTIDDLIMERNRAEQQRFRNALIDEARRIDPDFDPSRYDAHHIVPLSEYPELSGLRDRLAGWGIDLNDASINGVPSPRSSDVGPGTVHADTQRNSVYETAIQRRFEGITTREQALFELNAIKQELRDGTFVPPKK